MIDETQWTSTEASDVFALHWDPDSHQLLSMAADWFTVVPVRGTLVSHPFKLL